MGLSDITFPLQLSLRIALLATAGCAIVGVPFAYLLATREFRGKSLVDVGVMLPLVLPPVVTGYVLLMLIGKGGVLGAVTRAVSGTAYGITFTWEAAAIAAFVIAMPLAVSTARSAIAAVDRAHADASRTMGRGEFETAVFVVLPLAARGITAGLALAFARALGEFGATVMVAGNIPGRTNTMALEIYNAVLYGDSRTALTLALTFLVVSAGALLAANRLTRAVAA